MRGGFGFEGGALEWGRPQNPMGKSRGHGRHAHRSWLYSHLRGRRVSVLLDHRVLNSLGEGHMIMPTGLVELTVMPSSRARLVVVAIGRVGDCVVESREAIEI